IDDSGDKYYVAAFSDITARKLLESELLKEREMLQEQVTYDSLTKLLNRRKMEETLELEIERFKRCNTPLSVVMFDIDDFKQINDTLGHQAGDATLRLVSELIKKTVRKVDFSARWGGEEFIVLAPQTDTKGAYTLAENLRKTIEGSNILQGKKITCSFGVTDFKENETLDSFLKRVDEALYASKKNGKNQVTLV
ncbi:MAG: GGDEF domain-containing protein, partial [Campylobacterales bacterium]|nr:GGDEF domain-containing protein [Campylobacterales bacterium]